MTRAEAFALIDDFRTYYERFTEANGTGHWDCSNPDLLPAVKVANLAEACGDVAHEALVSDLPELRLALTRAAAVAVAWLESLEKGGLSDE